MTGGAIFLLLLFLVLVLYLGVGSCVKCHFYGARGMEAIPNIEFWRTLSSNIKDGVTYLCRGCRPRDQGYEEI